MDLKHKSLKLAAFLSLLLMIADHVDAGLSSEKNRTIVVPVTWGDINNTPANDVYIEAHGYVVKDKTEKSFIL